MTSTEVELREALVGFMCAAAERGDVAVALKRISELQRQLTPETDPMLRHYLERRSYQKALDLLNTGHAETDKPQCGN